MGVQTGIDPKELAQAGWGVVFPAAAEERTGEIREALSELLELRREQSGERYRELGGSDGYRPGESKARFLARHGMGPGPADPAKVPYYLLVVGSPEEIPFRFQLQLDLQYAVGRLHFDSPADYANYARGVVTAEAGGGARPRAVFCAVEHPGDAAGQLLGESLIRPVAERLAEQFSDRQVWQIAGRRVSKDRLTWLLAGGAGPTLLVASGHGVTFPRGDPRQRERQGALLCSDWYGPSAAGRPISSDLYLAARDVAAEARLAGSIAVLYSSFSAGTPRIDDLARQAQKDPVEIAPAPFVGRLPQRLLGHPAGGALAVVGWLDRVMAAATAPPAEILAQTFESFLVRLLDGYPVGMALEHFSELYAERAVRLADELEELQFGKEPQPAELGALWMVQQITRSVALLGDPAVRLAA